MVKSINQPNRTSLGAYKLSFYDFIWHLEALLGYLKQSKKPLKLQISVSHLFRSSSTSPLVMPLTLSTRAARSRPGCSGLWSATPSRSSSCLPISTTRPTAASHGSSRQNLPLMASPQRVMAPLRHRRSRKMERNKRKEKENMTEKKHWVSWGSKCPCNLNRQHNRLFGNWSFFSQLVDCTNATNSVWRHFLSHLLMFRLLVNIL